MTKRKSKGAGERRQRKFTPWESDRVTPSSPSSLDVLMHWLTAPGNALRWRQARASKGLCQEVLTALEGHGISHREVGDVDIKVRVLEKQFLKASAFLSGKKTGEAFEQGDADVVKHVLRLCPQYRELLTVFGRFSTGREVHVVTAAAVAAEQNNGVASSPIDAGRKSAAGKWKESLEKNRPRTASEEENAEQAARGLVKQNNAANGESRTSKEKRGAGSVAGVATVVASWKKSADDKFGDQKNNINGKDDVVEEEDGTLADVESEDEPKTQIHVESEGESSEEEEPVPQEAAVATKSKYSLKTKQHEAEVSSSEEDSSDEETRDSQEDEVDDVDVEEHIPLAQPDEEQAEEDKANSEFKADRDDASDNNEEEGGEDDGEEEEEADEADAAKVNTSSNDWDSSSSESEESNDEAEAGSTPKTAKSSDHDQHNSENDGNDDDEMDEADHSDSDAEVPVRSRKRSSKEIPGPHVKRVCNVTHELEREAYIQRAKQEQAQRQQLFQLERAKLECELEAKRVHLAMEKTLARKKLLGAGVELAEVDRVLPL
ncbi:hypothetical protein PRNP1_000103 [Phytophthora ramorum]